LLHIKGNLNFLGAVKTKPGEGIGSVLDGRKFFLIEIKVVDSRAGVENYFRKVVEVVGEGLIGGGSGTACLQ
jgi:hypothetical protein